jgi:hypothetical protein
MRERDDEGEQETITSKTKRGNKREKVKESKNERER